MKTFKFYGVCGNLYKLDGKVWEAIEDPSDGYRSYLSSIELVEKPSNATFFSEPIAEVIVRESPEIEGWQLVDTKDNHVWLVVGTDQSDDYYPYFVFQYNPKPEKLTWNKFISD